MLRRLSIRDYAIIDALDLDFASGFLVLSGETGAGKSILIGALGLLLGDRAEGGVVRSGRERAELSAEFDLQHSPDATQWLKENELTDPDDARHCLVRRVIGSDGRSRAFINASAAPLSHLRELGERLVEIHGQHEHQRLTQIATQRALLDESGVAASLLEAVADAAREYQKLCQAIERARALASRDPGQLDYLRQQVRELEALGLTSDELTQLDSEHKQLAHAGRLIEDGGLAQELLLSGENNLHDQLNRVETLLQGLSELHEGFGEFQTLVTQARLQAREAADGLRRMLDRLELDPERLVEVEQRLAAIHELARKHRVRREELPQHLTTLQEESSLLEQAAGDLGAWTAKQEAALKTYQAAAQKLTAARDKAASVLAPKVSNVLRELGMPQAQLQIVVAHNENAAPRAIGSDEVSFDFSANPGQPPRPLAKVASGGELSRLSLAIQVTVRQASSAQTLIFDEVDAGIGGAVAETVGRKLHELARSGQVLCITHLPQVAAQGDHHYAIRKEVKTGQTYTRVSPLVGKARIDEIARMLGGKKTSAATEALAKDLLKA